MNRRGKTKPEKNPIKLIVSAVVFVLVVFCFFIYKQNASEQTVVAKVNGDEITAAEFKRVLEMQRALVIDHFTKSDYAELDKDFWYTDYHGEVPADFAKKMALAELVKLKIQLKLAKEKGLITDTSYGFLLDQMNRENERRADAIREGNPVYGPEKFGENNFIEYYTSNLIIKLKEILSEKELAVTDTQLLQHYESIKEKLYKLEDTVRFKKISVSFLKDGLKGSLDEEKKQKAAILMNEIKKQLDNGRDIDELIHEKQGENSGLEINYTEEEMDEDTAREYAKMYPLLYTSLKENTDINKISDVLEESMSGEYVISKVLKRESNGYKEFEKYKDSVKSDYLNMTYQQYVSELIKNAKVDILEENYNKIKLQ